MQTNTVKYLERVLDERKEPMIKIGKKRKVAKKVLEMWHKYLSRTRTSARRPTPITPDANTRMIRPSILLSFTLGTNIITPILYEIKENSHTTLGKLHGGHLDLDKGFNGADQAIREMKEEMYWAQDKLDLSTISPECVLTTIDGMVLQYYHARIIHKPNREDLKNPRMVGEKFESRFYDLDTLTEMIELGPLDIHRETMEAILTKHLWRKSVLAVSLPIPYSASARLLEKAGIENDPSEMDKCNVYVSTPYSGLPRAMKIFVAAGAFLHEVQFDTHPLGMHRKLEGGEAMHLAEEYMMKKWDKLMEGELLERYRL